MRTSYALLDYHPLASNFNGKMYVLQRILKMLKMIDEVLNI